jgi:hypothetical protein
MGAAPFSRPVSKTLDGSEWQDLFCFFYPLIFQALFRLRRSFGDGRSLPDATCALHEKECWFKYWFKIVVYLPIVQ